jgi:hypothetical protein
MKEVNGRKRQNIMLLYVRGGMLLVSRLVVFLTYCLIWVSLTDVNLIKLTFMWM